MFKDFVRIAFKSLAKRKIRSWLTMIGIIIGIAAVVSLISLGQGLKVAVAQQFQALGTERIVVQAKGLGGGPPGTNVAVPLTQEDLEAIQNTRGVDVATGRLLSAVKVSLEDKNYFAYLATMPSNSEEREFINEVTNYEIIEGRDLKPGEKYKVVLGYNFKDKPLLGRPLRLGDVIEVQGEEFEVIGFYKRLGSFQVDGTIVMNEDIAREILDEPEEYDVIQASVVNVEEIDLVSESIMQNLRKVRDVKEGKENFEVQTSQQVLQSLNRILSIVTYFLVGIAFISIIVGGVGITNTMYTSVLERNKEIGIMKAIGARNSHILSIFLFESGLLGLVGGLIGIMLGIGLGLLVEVIGKAALGTELIQASFSPLLILGALAFSFLIGALAGTLPAIRAAKLSPVDALRRN